MNINQNNNYNNYNWNKPQGNMQNNIRNSQHQDGIIKSILKSNIFKFRLGIILLLHLITELTITGIGILMHYDDSIFVIIMTTSVFTLINLILSIIVFMLLSFMSLVGIKVLRKFIQIALGLLVPFMLFVVLAMLDTNDANYIVPNIGAFLLSIVLFISGLITRWK